MTMGDEGGEQHRGRPEYRKSRVVEPGEPAGVQRVIAQQAVQL
jgi:hypothetical protein